MTLCGREERLMEGLQGGTRQHRDYDEAEDHPASALHRDLIHTRLNPTRETQNLNTTGA